MEHFKELSGKLKHPSSKVKKGALAPKPGAPASEKKFTWLAASGGPVLINMTVGAPQHDAADFKRRIAALSGNVKVGKRLGATEVIRAERA